MSVFPCPLLPSRDTTTACERAVTSFPRQVSKRKLKSAQADGADSAWPEKPPTDNPAWQKWLTLLAGAFPFLLAWRATLTADCMCTADLLGPPSCPLDGGWRPHGSYSSRLTASKLHSGCWIQLLRICYSETVKWPAVPSLVHCNIKWVSVTFPCLLCIKLSTPPSPKQLTLFLNPQQKHRNTLMQTRLPAEHFLIH